MNTLKKTALINGAYGGIGSEIAKELAKTGYDLILMGRDSNKLEILAAEVRKFYPTQDILIQFADSTQPESMQLAANKIKEKISAVDVLINTVGQVPIGHIETVTEEDWYTAFQVSLMSAVRLVKYFLPSLIKQKNGSIILINGILSVQPDSNFIISSTITGAIRNLIKALSHDLAHHNIRVNGINPGVTKTPLWDKITHTLGSKAQISAEMITDKVSASNPLKRIAKPTDIANVVKFLCDDASEYINGTIINIDGGQTLAA